MNTYLFPDSIFKDNLYYGFTMLEFVGLLVTSIILMFATIFISIFFIIFYTLVLLYAIFNHKPTFNESLYIEIKKRYKFHKEDKNIVMNLGGDDNEK